MHGDPQTLLENSILSRVSQRSVKQNRFCSGVVNHCTAVPGAKQVENCVDHTILRLFSWPFELLFEVIYFME